jgi:hypothetical protein
LPQPSLSRFEPPRSGENPGYFKRLVKLCRNADRPDRAAVKENGPIGVRLTQALDDFVAVSRPSDLLAWRLPG